MTDFGMAIGPYAAQDMSGLDIALATRKRQKLQKRQDYRYVPLIEILAQAGRLGRKTSAGWYDYSVDGVAASSSKVEELVEAASREAVITRRQISAAEIVDRLTTAMICEASDVLQEGIAKRPSDIDLVMVHGNGFPRWRGGLMHYADTIGPNRLLRALQAYRSGDMVSWPTPLLLDRLARLGTTFAFLERGAAL
jgi:3-hydroxyacyl-CoA dehydrogenase